MILGGLGLGRSDVRFSLSQVLSISSISKALRRRRRSEAFLCNETRGAGGQKGKYLQSFDFKLQQAFAKLREGGWTKGIVLYNHKWGGGEDYFLY